MKKNKRNLKIIFKGIFYDDTYDDVKEIVSYIIETNNYSTKKYLFQFEYSLNKIINSEGYKLTKQCINSILF